jgi:hypothetical protein
MVTKDEIKEAVDQIPDKFLEEAYTFLRKLTSRTKRTTWTESETSLHKFTADFMDNRNQPSGQMRDSFD